MLYRRYGGTEEKCTVKKQEAIALLESMPDEFDVDELIYRLSLNGSVERAEAEYAARQAAGEGSPEARSWEQRRARYFRTIEILMCVTNNKALMAQVTASFEAIERGERGIPFREIQEDARRRRGEE